MEDHLPPASDDLETLKQQIKALEARIERLEKIIETGVITGLEEKE